MIKEDSKSKDSSLKKESHLKEYLEDNSDEQIRKAEDYLKKINDQLTDRFSRIEKIKESHEKFEQEIEKLQSGTNSKSRESYVEMVNGVFDVPDAIKVNAELSELIEKYAVEKLDLMKKLFINEKKQTKEISNKLKENLSRIAISEQKLIRQRDDLEIELREKNKRLVQVERLSAIGELSARLAHDLRNPLTVIKGVVEISKTKGKTPLPPSLFSSSALLQSCLSS